MPFQGTASYFVLLRTTSYLALGAAARCATCTAMERWDPVGLVPPEIIIHSELRLIASSRRNFHPCCGSLRSERFIGNRVIDSISIEHYLPLR